MNDTDRDKQHDVKIGGKLAKADEHPWPHLVSCSGCRIARVCHGCGKPIDKYTRCTSGGCPRCCGVHHKHPQHH